MIALMHKVYKQQNKKQTIMKHYTIAIFEKPPKGGLLRYEGIEAENKSDLRKKVSDWNKASKDEYMKLESAFTLRK